jgi:hypothetical protein
MADTVYLDVEASPFSATEQKCFNELWAQAPVHDGYLPGAAAVKFLSASKLPKTVLRKIWYVYILIFRSECMWFGPHCGRRVRGVG